MSVTDILETSAPETSSRLDNLRLVRGRAEIVLACDTVGAGNVMRRTYLLVVAVSALSLEAIAQERPSLSPGRIPTDAEIVEAVGAIERAEGYSDLVAATERYGAILGSERTSDLISARLQDATLGEEARGLLMLERQLSVDTRERGAAAAARLLSVRLIAGYALLANTPEEFAATLETFSPLAKIITPQLVRDALDTPDNRWPDALRPLMEQLARDWPARGALAAATGMAMAAAPPQPAADPSAPAASASTLTGHWRSTRILFDQPRDEHLVLRADGTAETWLVTAESRTPVTPGRWRVQGTNLFVEWQDGRQWGQPFTFHLGQLVFPNVPNQRQFWEPVR